MTSTVVTSLGKDVAGRCATFYDFVFILGTRVGQRYVILAHSLEIFSCFLSSQIFKKAIKQMNRVGAVMDIIHSFPSLVHITCSHYGSGVSCESCCRSGKIQWLHILCLVIRYITDIVV